MAAEETILYDLLVHKEWKLEEQLLPRNYLENRQRNWSWIWRWIPWPKFLGKPLLLSPVISGILKQEIPWKLATNEESSAVVAVLQLHTLEIYEYDKNISLVPIGKRILIEDPLPHFRNIVWAENGTILCLTYSDGRVDIVDAAARLLYSIFSPNLRNNRNHEISNSYLMTVFTKLRTTSRHWISELILLDYHGNINSFLLSNNGFQEFSRFSRVKSYYPYGLTAAAFSGKHGLLVIAGKISASKSKLSLWRLLDQNPYFKMIETFKSFVSSNDIYHVSVSPSENYVVTIDTTGTISVRQLLNLRLYFEMELRDQPCYDDINPNLLKNPKLKHEKKIFLESKLKWNPIDIQWWDDDSIIVSRFSGALSILTIKEESKNLLGDSAEFFSSVPIISKRISGKLVFCIESEIDSESISDRKDGDDSEEKEIDFYNPIKLIKSYLYLDKSSDEGDKTVQKMYRLIAMISTTPEELYTRKIDKEEYGEALVLARHYDLDCDLVYERQWRTSDYSSIAIHDFLAKIKRKSTIRRECLEVVPSTIEGSFELLNFGLRTTNQEMENETDSVVIASMTSIKQTFVDYIKLLNTYERILESFGQKKIYYSREFYGEFRKRNIVESVTEFARIGEWRAVEIIFTQHFEQIAPHYFSVLSHFPECHSPSQYLDLFPSFNFMTKKIEFSFAINTDEEEVESKFNITEVSEWIKERALEMERITGLPDNSIELLELAKAKGIRVDERVLQDLRILEMFIHKLQKIDGIDYTTLKNLSNEMIVHEILTKKNKFIKTRIRKYLLPFLLTEDNLSPGSYYGILENYFLYKAQESLKVPLEVIYALPPNRLEDPKLIEICLNTLYNVKNALREIRVIEELVKFLLPYSSSPTTELPEISRFVDVNLILNKYSCNVPIEVLKRREDVEFIEEFFADFFLQDGILDSLENNSKWNEIFQDVFKVQEYFPTLTSSRCFELLVQALLMAEREKLIRQIAEIVSQTTPTLKWIATLRKDYGIPELSHSKTQALLLDAAESYFDKSFHVTDKFVKICKICLHFTAGSEPRAVRLKNLLNALIIFLEFSVIVKPADLRSETRPVNIIVKVLEAKKENYKKSSKLLNLACLLQKDGEDLEMETEMNIATYAFKNGDYQCCYSLCKKLMETSYRPSWRVCLDLLKSNYSGIEKDREKIVAFCLSRCDNSQLGEIIELTPRDSGGSSTTGSVQFKMSNWLRNLEDPGRGEIENEILTFLERDIFTIDLMFALSFVLVERVYVLLRALKVTNHQHFFFRVFAASVLNLSADAQPLLKLKPSLIISRGRRAKSPKYDVDAIITDYRNFMIQSQLEIENEPEEEKEKLEPEEEKREPEPEVNEIEEVINGLEVREASPEEKYKAFRDLFEDVNLKSAEVLAENLLRWPKIEGETWENFDSNPWVMIFRYFISNELTEVSFLVQIMEKVRKTQPFPPEFVERLVEESLKEKQILFSTNLMRIFGNYGLRESISALEKRYPLLFSADNCDKFLNSSKLMIFGHAVPYSCLDHDF